MSLRQKSKVWKYFGLCDEDDRFAICVLCNAKISRGGFGKEASTSSLLKHLKFKHFNEHGEVIAKEPDKETKSKKKQMTLPNLITKSGQ